MLNILSAHLVVLSFSFFGLHLLGILCKSTYHEQSQWFLSLSISLRLVDTLMAVPSDVQTVVGLDNSLISERAAYQSA